LSSDCSFPVAAARKQAPLYHVSLEALVSFHVCDQLVPGVAAHFLMDQANVIPTLSTTTIDRFEAVIDALASALPAVP
jgi:hypothetical protein